MTVTDTVIRGPVKKDRPAPVTRTVTRRTVAGDELGSVDLEPSIFGIEPNLAVLHQVVTAQLAAIRAGTQSTKTRVAGPWRRGQAVRPEGHRPGPSGFQPIAVDERWRHCPRAQAPQLQAAHPQEDGAPGAAVGPERPGGQRPGRPGRPVGLGRSEDQGRRRGAHQPQDHRHACWWCWPTTRRSPAAPSPTCPR